MQFKLFSTYQVQEWKNKVLVREGLKGPNDNREFRSLSFFAKWKAHIKLTGRQKERRNIDADKD